MARKLSALAGVASGSVGALGAASSRMGRPITRQHTPAEQIAYYKGLLRGMRRHRGGYRRRRY